MFVGIGGRTIGSIVKIGSGKGRFGQSRRQEM